MMTLPPDKRLSHPAFCSQDLNNITSHRKDPDVEEKYSGTTANRLLKKLSA